MNSTATSDLARASFSQLPVPGPTSSTASVGVARSFTIIGSGRVLGSSGPSFYLLLIGPVVALAALPSVLALAFGMLCWSVLQCCLTAL